MTNMLRSRLARRVLTEQHIGLTEQHDGKASQANSRFIGTIDTQLAPDTIAQDCVQLLSTGPTAGPVLVETLGPSSTIAYIPDHLTFMFFELIKNSLRATAEHHPGVAASSLPPVRVSIAHSQEEVVVRISDHGQRLAHA
jgi:signal transduction histidine kinase